MPDELTRREREVIALVRRGLTNEQIAERLGITADGVKYHISETMSKLGAESRYEAAELAVGKRKWWVYAPLIVVVAAVVAVLVLALGVANSGGDRTNSAGGQIEKARAAVQRIQEAASQPDEVLHSNRTVEESNGVYKVEYWVDGARASLREESAQNIFVENGMEQGSIDKTIVHGDLAYDEGAPQPRPLHPELCDLTNEGWVVIFLRICLIQSVIGAENYNLTVERGEWEGQEADVVRAEGDFAGAHNAFELYIDAISDLPLAIVTESSRSQRRNVTTFEHEFIPLTEEIEALLDPTSIGAE